MNNTIESDPLDNELNELSNISFKNFNITKNNIHNNINKNNFNKKVNHNHFITLNSLFAECIGWTVESLYEGVPPINYGAPYSDIFELSKRRQKTTIPKYTKDMTSIWDSIFFIKNNNINNFEIELINNWELNKNIKEEYDLFFNIYVYFNEKRLAIYSIPVNKVALAFCLLYCKLNNKDTSRYELFFRMPIQPMIINKK